MVVRLREPPGVGGICEGLEVVGVKVAPSKDWVPVCSTADKGGVAVMVMELGKRTSFESTEGDCGCADRGVSR